MLMSGKSSVTVYSQNDHIATFDFESSASAKLSPRAYIVALAFPTFPYYLPLAGRPLTALPREVPQQLLLILLDASYRSVQGVRGPVRARAIRSQHSPDQKTLT